MLQLINRVLDKGKDTAESIAKDLDAFCAKITTLNVFDTSGAVRLQVHYGLYCKTIKNLGTEKHQQALLDACVAKTLGCFALTEMGHGSNVRGIETTATYDHEKAQFVLHSPTQTSIKFWIGGLAKVATHTTVFANLIVDGKN